MQIYLRAVQETSYLRRVAFDKCHYKAGQCGFDLKLFKMPEPIILQIFFFLMYEKKSGNHEL